jgi:phosphoribosylformylglycinamidine cyclo-ligase
MPGQFDLAGACVGKVEYEMPGVREGDVLLALPANGLHANGITRARKQLGDDIALLRPTPIYAPTLVELWAQVRVSAVANITGGGWDNLKRIWAGTWEWRQMPPLPPIYRRLAPMASDRDWNLGLGFAVVVEREDRRAATRFLAHRGFKPQGAAIATA